MKNKLRINLILFVALVCFQSSGYSQRLEEWSCLIPLKSTRLEVEKILGKPHDVFDTYGRYDTPYGRYSVWYASGRCQKKVEGRDWNVEAGIMTSLLVYPNKVNLLNDYLHNISDYEKRDAPGGYSSFLYLNKDESIIYQTKVRPEGSEFVSAISLEPGNSKDKLLCNNINH